MFRHTFVASLVLVVSSCAFAQEAVTTAAVSGSVTDSTGANIPAAHVVALQSETNQRYTVHTDTQGRFRLVFLPVGSYRITAQAPGFRDAIHEVHLSAGSALDLNLPLAVASAAITVDANAGVDLVEVNRSQIAETVQTNEIDRLPFAGRNYLDLALLAPGVSPTNTNSTQTLAETAEVPGQGYSVNSQRNFSNSFVVDGVSSNDDAAGVAGNLFSMDAVREFQVVTSGGQAEFGRALGGYFNIITRSGTNALHGTAYGFLRNQRLNAANALVMGKVPLTQGQYGGSLSGPLRRNRTFLFGNFEEQRLRTNRTIIVSPSAAALIDARLLAVGYRAPLLPVSVGATTPYPNTLHTDTMFVRADHRVNDRDRVEARYSMYQLSSRNARGNGGLNEVSNGTSVYDTNHTAAVSNLVTLSARAFLETRALFTYDNLFAPPNDTVGPAVTIAGVAVFGRSTSSPVQRGNWLGEFVNNVVLEHGQHTWKAGADFLYNDDTITFPMALAGSYTFSSLTNFLAGTYNTQGFTQNFGNPVVHQTNPNLGLYLQDEWRASSTLTLNVGARYDLDFLETIATDTDNVSPRIGFAWSPFTDHRTVVRGSYGVFFDRVPLRPLANALLSAHNTTDPTQAALLSYTFSPGQPGAPVFPAVAAAPPTSGLLNYTLMQRHLESPFSQQVSLQVEQEMLAKTFLAISYQHVRGEHLLGVVNTNINADGSRPDPTRGNIRPYSSAFDSYYDGLEVSVRHTTATWGSTRLSYTWSKAIDNVGEFFFSAPINNFSLREDRSRSDDDQRHRLVLDATLNTPTSAAHSLAARLAHGWRLGGILQYYSRLPFNITTGGTTRQGTSQRPCLGGISLVVSPGITPCTEALPGAVIGRNAGVGFDFFTLNARFSRTFALGDRLRLETIAEGFNTLNRRNNLVPNGVFGANSFPALPSADFGKATAVADQRSVQLAARISF